jgi:hypothetical protein
MFCDLKAGGARELIGLAGDERQRNRLRLACSLRRPTLAGDGAATAARNGRWPPLLLPRRRAPCAAPARSATVASSSMRPAKRSLTLQHKTVRCDQYQGRRPTCSRRKGRIQVLNCCGVSSRLNASRQLGQNEAVDMRRGSPKLEKKRGRREGAR